MAGRLDSTFAGENGIANKRISEYGTTAQVDYQNDTYDPKAMTESGVTAVSYPIPIGPVAEYSNSEIDGTTIVKGDVRASIPSYGTPEKPPQGATVTFNSETWSIKHVDSIMSGEEVCLYILQLRRV